MEIEIHKCHICNKKFNKKFNLKRHLKKLTPCKKNRKCFKCSKCGKSYTSKSNLKRHVYNLCSVHNENDQPLTQLPYDENSRDFSTKCSKLKQDTNKYSNKCKYCNKDFSRNDNFNRHLNKYCKIKKDIVMEKEQIFQKLLENATNEIRNEMTDKINELKYNHKITNNNITNITNNNNNSNITNNINIQLVAYGKEDKNLLKNTELFKILGKGFKSVPELIKAIHFNEEHPENHNIYISNMRDKYVMVYDGDKWILEDKKNTIDDMFHDGRDLLVIKCNDIKQLLDDKYLMKLKKFERFDKQIDLNSDKKLELIEDIKLMLYNNRNMVLDSNNKLT
jgi:hypothetical protein